MPRIDSHAHVFTAGCRLAANRRYTPAREAPVESYLATLDRFGFSHGVLVQPHFLGSDNSYLVNCLRAAPERLRGVVMLEPGVADARLDDYQAAGVVGVRVNLIGEDPDLLAEGPWQALFHRVAARGWLIQVHALGAAIPRILDHLWPCGAPLLIDHFGRPDPDLGLDDPGFRAILARAAGGRLWVKLSGPYRWYGVDVVPYVEALLREVGPGRLVWGSDWPWTRTTNGIDFPQLQRWLGEWLPDERDQALILGDTPARLFRFDGAAGERSAAYPPLGDWATG